MSKEEKFLLKVIKQYTEPTENNRLYPGVSKGSSDALPFLPNFGGSAKNVLGNMFKGAADAPARTNTMVDDNNSIKKVAHGRLSLTGNDGFT